METTISIESEQIVLGLILIQERTEGLDRAIEILKPSDFFRDVHEILFAEMVRLRGEGKSVESVSLDAEITAKMLAKKFGAPPLAVLSYCSGLMDEQRLPMFSELDYHLERVRDLSLKRSLLGLSEQIKSECLQADVSPQRVAETIEGTVHDLIHRTVASSSSWLCDAILQFDERMHLRMDGQTSGFPTGLADLDGLTGGMRAGELIVIGARPSIGKTSLGLQIADHMAYFTDRTSLIVSLEMNTDSLVDRLMAVHSGVDLQKIMGIQTLTDSDIRDIDIAREKVRNRPILIDDASDRTTTQIAANARRQRARGAGLGVVMIDYVQLLAEDRRFAKREEEVSWISRRLKNLARSLKVPVIALAQLNRLAEGRKDHKPMLSDLRESGAIEQDADQVWLLHRPCFYDKNDRPGEADLIVAKNRNGRTGTVHLAYQDNITRFDNKSYYQKQGSGDVPMDRNGEIF